MLVFFISFVSADMLTFEIEGNKENIDNSYDMKTYVVGRRVVFDPKVREARKRNDRWIWIEDEIERCLEKRTKNRIRTFGKKSYEKVYDEENDEWVTTNVFYETDYVVRGYGKVEEPRFRWMLRNKALNGEKVC